MSCPQFADHEHSFTVAVPQGDHDLDWVDPKILTAIRNERLHAQGWMSKVTTPGHTIDIAMRLRRL